MLVNHPVHRASKSRQLTRIRAAAGGFTIIEMLIAVTLGLLLTAIVIAIFIGNRVSTVTQRDVATISQNGAFALDVVSGFFRQAGHRALDGMASYPEPTVPPKFCQQAVVSASLPTSNTVVGGAVEGYDSSTATGAVVGSSDAVILRFYGSSAQRTGAPADGSITDCVGKPVLGPLGSGTFGRTWLKLYVATDSDTGNPALYCSSLKSGDTTASTQSLVDNVESFQVLYGVGARYDPTVTDKVPAGLDAASVVVIDKYLPASSMTTADWDNVASVRFGLVISGDANSRGDADASSYNLFGVGYPTTNGAVFDASSATSLDASRRSRIRKVFSTTVELRNAPLPNGSCEPS